LMVRGVPNTARGMLTPAQLRAARALLGWSQDILAKKCGGEPDLSTLKRFEAGKSDPKQSTLLAWKRALARAGVEFTDGGKDHGPGVRFRDPQN
jgi:transcriptional regulator with XRE-family HTH domain